jgi:hypothetical protein
MDIAKGPRTTADLILYDDVLNVFRKIRTILCLAGNAHDHHTTAADRLTGTPAENGLLRTSNDLLIEAQELIYEQLEAAEDLVKWRNFVTRERYENAENAPTGTPEKI